MEYFNPHDNDWLKCKFEIYKDLRKREQAYYSQKYKMHVITRYDDVAFVLANPDTFSSARGNLIVESPHRFGKTLGASDDPIHQYLKNIVKKAYSKDNLDRIENSFAEYAKQLLSTSRIIDLSDIVDHMSSLVSAETIGLPIDKMKVKDLIVDIQRCSSRCVSMNQNDSGYNKFLELTISAITKKIPATQNGIYKEYIEHLILANDMTVGPLSLITGPTISGASSMTGALQFLTIDLYENKLINTVNENRDLIPLAVNEALRYRASTGRFSRTVAKEITMHGINLKPGDRVAVCLESANRDEVKFKNPDQFDLHRNVSGHLSFGYGMHSCIAMAISKLIMTSYLTILLDQIGNYTVLTNPNDYQFVMTASGNDDMISNLFIEKLSF